LERHQNEDRKLKNGPRLGWRIARGPRAGKRERDVGGEVWGVLVWLVGVGGGGFGGGGGGGTGGGWVCVWWA